MFSVGDTVIYGNTVCRITGTKDMKCEQKVRKYYVLTPIYERHERDSTYYLPIGSKKVERKMIPTLSADEIRALIKDMPNEDTIWIENKNERAAQYKQILAGEDRRALVKLIKTLHLQQRELKAAGRKLNVADAQFLRYAEKALYDEFALVLNIEREEILPYIAGQMEEVAREDDR